MKISICMNTARESFSMIAMPDVHIFEYLMASLRTQTFKDFEVVIADVLYEQRKDYFMQHPESFTVKHVPIKPNLWTPINSYAISTTKNTCLMYVEGEYIMFIDDCGMMEPECLQKTIDNKEAPVLCTIFEVKNGDEFLGYGTSNPDPEKRVETVWGNNIFIPTELMFDLNGYDEMFDGTRGYEDGDLFTRLTQLNIPYAVNNSLYTYQAHKAPLTINFNLRCPTLWLHCANSRIVHRGITKANSTQLLHEEFYFIAGPCIFIGDQKMDCLRQKYDGVYHKCPYSGNTDRTNNPLYKNAMSRYKSQAMIFDLREQRKDINATLEYLKKEVENASI